jgi:hypothetical protein
VADATNAPVQPTESGAPDPGRRSSSGFLATTTGKIVVGVVALVVLVVIAGAIVFMLASGGVAGLLKSGGVTVKSTTVTASVATTSAAGTAPILEPSQKPLTSSFTFRNVFAPSIKPPVAPSAETSGSSSSGSTNSPDTLYLVDIVSTDGVMQGVFVWNGVTYTEGAGGTIDSSPWKVLEVNSDSVVMLFGDTQVTLTVGQGVSK